MAAGELTRSTAADLAALLKAGEVSSVEVTQAHLDRIAAVDGGGDPARGVHAFLHVAGEQRARGSRRGRRRARRRRVAARPGRRADRGQGRHGHAGDADDRRVADPGRLGAAVRRDRRPAPPRGAAGDARQDEHGRVRDGLAPPSTRPSARPATPGTCTRIPGGSGGGSSAALAAFEAPLATGTDTGGSIRQPAAVTGTVGVKPTYGGVSRYGLIALASSLDQAGPCARTVLDAALLHEVMAGHDPMDSTSLTDDVPGVRRGGARRRPGRASRACGSASSAS